MYLKYSSYHITVLTTFKNANVYFIFQTHKESKVAKDLCLD